MHHHHHHYHHSSPRYNLIAEELKEAREREARADVELVEMERALRERIVVSAGVGVVVGRGGVEGVWRWRGL